MMTEDQLKQHISQRAKEILPEMIAFRRHLHQFPELSFEEYNTSSFIKEFLKKNNVSFSDRWVRTGVVAEFGNLINYGSTVALRADIDALPIEEENDIPYKSKNIGVMHACGHDVHTTCLMGALLILNSINIEWQNRMIGIFQPGEEKLPGGAQLMIAEGLLEKYNPKAIFGLHVLPQMDAGYLGLCPGQSMASSDEIYITITGKGGHGAMPHLAIDPILISSKIISGIQEIVSRNADPMIPSVLSFGKINSVGGATNIIPQEVKIEGTFRTMDETWRQKAHEKIAEYITNTAQASEGTATIDIKKGYPCLVNSDSEFAYGEEKLKNYLSDKFVQRIPPRMTSEDFAYYSQAIPALFFRLGTGNKSLNKTSPVHTSTFDIDETALETGMGAMAYLAACKML